MKKKELVTHTTSEEIEVTRCDECKVSDQEFHQMKFVRNWHERETRLPHDMLRRTEKQDFCSFKCEYLWLRRFSEAFEQELNKPFDGPIVAYDYEDLRA